LAETLRQQGQFAEALTVLKRGHELGFQNPHWSLPSAQVIREVEHLLEAEAKLPAFLRGEARPADNAERLALAGLCHNHKRLYGTAGRLYAEAFVAQAALADDVQAGYRDAAAVAAARAGCGQGKDAPPDGPERARWRQQALEWRQAELTAYAKLVEGGQPGDQ